MADDKVCSIDVTKLPFPQLSHLKRQLDSEVELVASSLQQLKIAQSKFQESSECVSKLGEEAQSSDVLVPLTDSMYVPAELEDVSKVLIDVGTGYFVEKDIPSAKDYFSRKVKYVTTQIEKLQHVAKEKIVLRDIIIDTMTMKEKELQAILAKHETAATGKS